MNRVIALLMLMTVAAFANPLPSSQQNSNPNTSPAPTMMQRPMKLAGTEVNVSDTYLGVALTITTNPDNVAALRQDVERMATMHRRKSSSAVASKGHQIPWDFTYESIENGARLTLTPKDPENAEALRKQVREHVEHMRNGTCSMMQDMMRGMMHEGVESAPKEDGTDHSSHHP